MSAFGKPIINGPCGLCGAKPHKPLCPMTIRGEMFACRKQMAEQLQELMDTGELTGKETVAKLIDHLKMCVDPAAMPVWRYAKQACDEEIEWVEGINKTTIIVHYKDGVDEEWRDIGSMVTSDKEMWS